MSIDLQQRLAVVTGGASNIGRGITLMLADANAHPGASASRAAICPVAQKCAPSASASRAKSASTSWSTTPAG